MAEISNPFPAVKFKQSWLHLLAFVFLGLAVADLACGSGEDGNCVLPFSLSEHVDLVLLVVGVFLLFFLH
jgi:hypothetical protein